MPDLNEQLRAVGVSRDAESPSGKGILVSFNRAPTDDELRTLHDQLRQHGSAAQAVAWEVKESTGWEPLAACHVEHAKSQGREVRALGVTAPPVAAEQPAAAGNALTGAQLDLLLSMLAQGSITVAAAKAKIEQHLRAAPQAAQGEGLTDCDKSFDDWYAAQRHQLTNEQVCRLIWTRAWDRAIAAHTRASDGLGAVREAVTDYYRALDNRQHGGVAQSNAFAKIEEALGMSWSAHREAMQQAASNSAEGAHGEAK